MPPEARRPSLGLAACTAIVVGNMVGSGFYLSPTALAPYGLLAILTWIVMGIGAICLGLTFARLAALYSATGGPYAFTRLAYGDFAGFIDHPRVPKRGILFRKRRVLTLRIAPGRAAGFRVKQESKQTQRLRLVR